METPWALIAVAALSIVGNVTMWLLNRKTQREDRKVITLSQMAEKIKTIERGQMAILHDRIKFLSRSYVRDGELYYDDYQDLVEMHKIYSELGGTNLVRPMEDVSKLKMLYK